MWKCTREHLTFAFVFAFDKPVIPKLLTSMGLKEVAADWTEVQEPSVNSEKSEIKINPQSLNSNIIIPFNSV